MFPPEALDGAATAERGADPASAALREFLLTAQTPEVRFPVAGWYRVLQTADSVIFLARIAGDPPWMMVGLARSEHGWTSDAYGACHLAVALRDGFGLADWWLAAPGLDVGPDTTMIDALVRERACTSGRSPVGRLVPPIVTYEANAVVVTIAVRSLPGGQDCPGNPAVPITITLREQLGQRALLDGATVPPSAPLPPS